MKKIIYILGSGRSGSTLLDIILGNAETVFSCGELRRFVPGSGVPRPDEQKKESVAFWKKISKILDDKFPGLDREEFEKRYRKIEYHSRFIMPWRLNRREMYQYKKYVNALLDIVFEESGADWVVDSSKYPGRLLALLKVSEYPVYVVNLTRHPVGVVQSFGRSDVELPGKGFWAANYYYAVNGFLCKVAFHRVPDDFRLKIRYEDLLRDPAAVLLRISQKFGINLERPMSIAANRGAFKVGYLVDGNRIRKEDEIVLRPAQQPFGWNLKSGFTRLVNRVWY